ncbi:MAG: DNA/RNA non-specific endonuclease, partial [Saprospiraceae bacterium]|nr:DNA/RNA non-specific endonuclease [Saprospiraceae bacterium]
EEEAIKGAKQTFFYTNAAPQHLKVNRSIWRRIEDYILKKEAVKHNLRINVFTGPIMTEDDPDFVTPVNDEIVQLPITFWKIVYYTSEEGILHRVAFLVGQKYLLEKHKIVKRRRPKKVRRDRFINFKKADTYQVNVQTIEELSGLTFPQAVDAYHDERPIKLVLSSVNVRRGSKVVKEEDVKGLIL